MKRVDGPHPGVRTCRADDEARGPVAPRTVVDPGAPRRAGRQPPSFGRMSSGMSARRGLLGSRAERTGSRQAPVGRRRRGRPRPARFVGVVVVAVDQVGEQDVGEGGETVGHPAGDEEALVDVAVEVDHLGRPVGAASPAAGRAARPAPCPAGRTSSRPGAGGSAGPPGPRPASPTGCPGPSRGRVAEPAAPVGLDEAASGVAVHVRADQEDVVDVGEGTSSGMGANGTSARPSGRRNDRSHPVEEERRALATSMATTRPVTIS